MRRHADRALEEADQLEGREADVGGQLLQPQLARVFGVHAILHALEQGPVARRHVDPHPAAVAMPLEQPAEGGDQQLALAEDVPPLLDRQMHRQERIDQVAVGEDIAGEVRHVLQAEAARDLRQRRAREIHRAIAPALAPAHAAGVRLARIEHEQRRWRGLFDQPATAHDRAALLRHRDDQRLVGMQRIFVRREIGVQQAEAGEMPVPPVLGRIQGVAAGHGAIFTNIRPARATSLQP